MKIIKTFLFFAVIFSLFIISGCKKDNDVNPGDNNPPEYHMKTVQIPDAMAQSNDPGAQQAVSYINMMNSIANFANIMEKPSKSSIVKGLKDGTPRVFTWNIDEGNTHCTFTLTVTETSEDINWKMVVDGIMDGDAFDNFLFMDAQEAKDGSNSRLTVYDNDNDGAVLMTLSWYKTGDVYHFTFEMPKEIQMNIDINLDNSGTMEVNEWVNNDWVLQFKAVWGADGHGSWWDYMNTENGSW